MRGQRLISVVATTALIAGFQLLVLAAPPALATSITVNTELDPPQDPMTGKFPLNDGKCSLRAAIQSAQNNSNANDTDCATGLGNGVLDTIHINANLAGKTMVMTVAQPFDIVAGTDNPLEIIGPTTNSADFAISGNNATRIFLFGYTGFGGPSAANSAVVKLANLTVKAGDGTGGGAFFPDGDGGAAVLGDGTALTLDNVVFRDNNVSGSARGGAIWANQATITNNGGAYINNHANGNGTTGAGGGRGGAIAFFNAASTLNGYALLMEGNTASYSGGAMAAMNGNDNTVFHLERGLLKDNSAAVGGVYWTESGIAGSVFELQDSSVTGNSASQDGGVILTNSSLQSFSYLRDTFVNNTATGSGGLFYAGHGEIYNSIIKDSGCHNVGSTGNFSSASNLVAGTNTGCAFINNLGTVTNLDATLAQNGGPEVQRTYRLTSGSNAIDSGSITYCGTIDARSLPRGTDGNGVKNNPAAGDCDIGAYEYVKYVVNFVTGTSSVLEGGTAQVQVKLTIPDPADRPLPSAVSIPITRDQSSTARADIDYTVPPAGITFAAGSGSSGSATANYTVSIIQDDIAERFGENILFHLGPAAGVGIAEPKDHELSIQDDDQAGFTKTDGGNGTTVTEGSAATDSLSISLRSRPDYSQPDPNDSNSYGPPADVDVTLTPDRDCTVVADGKSGTLASPAQFTILNADWQSAHSIVVTPVDDLYDEELRDETVPHSCVLTFTFDSTDPVYAATTDSYTVTVGDNDVAGVTLSKTTLSLVEGGLTDSYTVRLDTPPDPGKPLPGTPRAATTVTVDPDAQCTVGNGPGVARTLSFTAATYATPQTVNVTAVDDSTVELDHTCTITTTVGGGDPVYTNLSALPVFAKTPASVVGAIKDYEPPTITNDPPQVDLSTGTGLSVSEATPGTAKPLTVVLDRQPLNQNVVVHLAGSSDVRIPGSQVLVQDSDAATPAAPAGTLDVTFTPANWNVPQVVQVFATNDDYDETDPHSAHLTATMTSTAVGFNSATLRKFSLDGDATHIDTVDVPVTIADNDTSSVVLSASASSVAVTEGGATDSYTVQLGTHPYGDVSVTVDPDAQCSVNGGAAGVPVALSFLAASWNVPQTVTVTAVDDPAVEGTHSCVITHVASSPTDSLYDALPGSSVTGVITDNDVARVVLHPDTGVAVSEAAVGTTDSYTVDLLGKPEADVTVTITDDGQSTASPSTLTFTSASWDTPQTVTVTAVDDAVDESDPHTGKLHHVVTSTATGYATAPQIYIAAAPAVNGDLPVQVSDNDTAGVTVTPSGGTTAVTEGGATDSYKVVLLSKPTADVTITPTPGSQCTVSPTSLTFTTATWNVPQTVTVTALNDSVVEDPTSCDITQAATSSDGTYSGISVATVPVTVTSDDVAGVTITGTSLSLSELDPATTGSYSVSLTSQPTSDVVVNALISDGQTTFDASATTKALTFTSATWSTPQVVTVHVVDDGTPETSPHAGTITQSVTSSSPGYTNPPVVVDNVTTHDVVFAIADDDGPDLGLAASGVSSPVIPGQLLTYTLSWTNSSSQPGTNVVLTTAVPAGTRFEPGQTTDVWSCGGALVAGTVCTLAVGTVGSSGTGSATFPVRVTAAAAGAETIPFSATIADDGTHGPDGNASNNSVSQTVDLTARPDLVVTQMDSGASAGPSSLLRYLVTVTNSGDQTGTGAVLTATVPTATTFDATTSGPGWSCADGSPAGTTCTKGPANLVAGQVIHATFAVQAKPTFPSGLTTLSSQVAVADDGTNGADPHPADNASTELTPVSAAPDLKLGMTDGGITTQPGRLLRYHLVLFNVGAQDAGGVVITEKVPRGTSFNTNNSTPGWTCTTGGKAGSICNLTIGALAAQKGRSIYFAVRVGLHLPADLTVITDGTKVKDNGSNGPDPTPLNNAASESTPLHRP